MLPTPPRARGAQITWLATLMLPVLALTALAGCQRTEAPLPPSPRPPAVAWAAPADTAALWLPDLMAYLVDPAAGVVLAAAQADASHGAEPRSSEAWQAVVDAAVQLAQWGGSLAAPPLALDRTDWQRWATAVRDGAAASGTAAARRDGSALALAAANIRSACESCHARYAPGVPEAAAPRGAPRADARERSTLND